MKYFFSLAIFFISFAPFMVHADIAPDPGYHEFATCAFVDNLADFSGYDIYMKQNWRFGPSAVIAQNPQVPSAVGYGMNCDGIGAPWFAVKQSDQAKLVHEIDEEHGDKWDILSHNQPYLIKALMSDEQDGVPRHGGNNLPDSNPLYTSIFVYHIDSLAASGFTYHFVSKSDYDKDNKLIGGPDLADWKASVATTTETQTQPQVQPQPQTQTQEQRQVITPINTWILTGVIVLLGLSNIILAMILWKKPNSSF